MIVTFTEIDDITTKDKNLNKLLKKSFFFDIETTGLSYKYCSIISITILLFIENKYKVCQLYCEHKIDEKEMIKYFNELLKDKEYLITYNGNTFDIPFMMNKALQNDIKLNLNTFIKIDIYNDVRKLHSKIETENHKLKSIEEFFNIKRLDTLTGQDITVLYEAYRIEPRKEFSDLILQHNYEDVFNLPILFNEILNLYDEIITYDNLIIKLNYEDFSIKKNNLIGNLNIISNFQSDYVHASFNFNIHLNIKVQQIKIEIPVNFFKNNEIEKFYYLQNDEFKLTSYTGIEGINKSLIPIQFDNVTFNDNIIKVLINILNSIF